MRIHAYQFSNPNTRIMATGGGKIKRYLHNFIKNIMNNSFFG